jgi:hypothetical protein
MATFKNHNAHEFTVGTRVVPANKVYPHEKQFHGAIASIINPNTDHAQYEVQWEEPPFTVGHFYGFEIRKEG